MAQLTNTHIYGTLDVDNVITAKNGINVTPLKNSTNTKDNSAKITLNSMIVDDKQNSANNENKLSSIMLSSENNSYGKIERESVYYDLAQDNSLHSYTAEIKNNAGKLLSLDLHRVNSEEHKVFDDIGSVIRLRDYYINKDDTLYNVSVNVSVFPKASDSEPDVNHDNVKSTYTADTKNDEATGISVTTNTTKSTVDVQLTVPYEGGEIITNETCDKERIARAFYVEISTTEQLTKLLNYSRFKKCVAGDVTNARGMILYAAMSYIATGTPSSYPVLFYIESNNAYMTCFSPSEKIFKKKSSLDSGEILRVVVSTKELYDKLTVVIA